MKKIFVSLTALILGLSAQAAVVSGRIMDSQYNEGEPYATVRVFQPNDPKPLTTIVSDLEGNFELDLSKPGEYIIEISAVGKESLIKNITVSGDQPIDLGTLMLSDNAQGLSELVVVAQKPLVQMTTDEMIYNVSADNDSKTYTLLEMLRKVPMVSVDGQDNITVNGSSNFQIYVDGKPSLLFSGNPSQIFKSMPASAVQNIEVVTNPGARFDAEGTGGIINLVMNKAMGPDMSDTKAYNASVNLRGGNRGFGGNIYATGQTGKLTASLNLLYHKAMLGRSETSTERVEKNLITETYSSSKPNLPFAMGNLNLNFDIDSLTTIGGSVALNTFNNHYNGDINTSIRDNNELFWSYLEDSDNRTKRQGINGSLSFSRYFGMQKKHQLNVTYQIAREMQDNQNTNTFDVLFPADMSMENRRSDSRMRTTDQIVIADLVSNFDPSNKLSVGAKGTFRDASAYNDYFINNLPDFAGSLDYKNNNKIAAAYAEYAFNKSLFGLKAGLRYEYTWQSISYGNDVIPGYKSRYGNFVPSGSLSFNLRQNSNIGVNYNMRISRPGISYLNPYVNQSDPTQITYGNPDLDIEKTHNVSLVYNLFNFKFSFNATLSNSYTGNGIEQFSFVEDGVLNTTYGNIVKRNNTSLNAFLNWNISPNTGINFNGGLSYLDIRSDQLNAHNKGLQGNFMFGFRQKLPWEISGNLFLIMSTKNRNLQGYTTGFKLIGVNFAKSFLHDNLSVNLGFNSGLSKGGKLHFDTYIETPEFTNKTTIKVAMLSVNVGVSFKFGSKVRVKEVRNNSIEHDYIDTRSQMESISNSDSMPAGR